MCVTFVAWGYYNVRYLYDFYYTKPAVKSHVSVLHVQAEMYTL